MYRARILGVLDATEFVTESRSGSVRGGPDIQLRGVFGPEIDDPSGLRVAQPEPMRFRPEDPPADKKQSDDPFAEFPLEPTVGSDAPKNHDWLSEFPDEKTATKVVRSKTWGRLSDSVKDEKS